MLKKIKIKNIFKSTVIIVLIVFLLFFFLEILAKNKFNSFLIGSCPYVRIKNNFDFNLPAKSCKYIFKHWEHNKEIIYETDELSNRKSTSPINAKKNIIRFAFFGDSFTWGEMNDSEENYPHYTITNLKKIKKINAGYNNYGVQGYDLLEVIARMKQVNLTNYDYIVYGLTPNDLFSPQILNSKKEIDNFEKTSFLKITKKIKTKNLTSVKVATKFFFDFFPRFYINLYTLRDADLGGYLSINSSAYWNDRYSELFSQLNGLDEKIRSKLIIQIIAQRVQVQLYNVGDINSAMAFENRVIIICNQLNIKCNKSQLDELALLKKSHYTVDGHFNSHANFVVGKKLSEFLSDL